MCAQPTCPTPVRSRESPPRKAKRQHHKSSRSSGCCGARDGRHATIAVENAPAMRVATARRACSSRQWCGFYAACNGNDHLYHPCCSTRSSRTRMLSFVFQRKDHTLPFHRTYVLWRCVDECTMPQARVRWPHRRAAETTSTTR